MFTLIIILITFYISTIVIAIFAVKKLSEPYRLPVFVGFSILFLTPSWMPFFLVIVPIPFGYWLFVCIAGGFQVVVKAIEPIWFWYVYAFPATGIIAYLVGRKVLLNKPPRVRLPRPTRRPSKYRFEGQVFAKGRLVLAIIKRYVETYPETTLAELEKVFPKRCHGSLGVVVTAEQANKIYAISARKRYFIDPEEVIKLPDSTVTINRQWDIRNIDRFITHARELGFTIDETIG